MISWAVRCGAVLLVLFLSVPTAGGQAVDSGPTGTSGLTVVSAPADGGRPATAVPAPPLPVVVEPPADVAEQERGVLRATDTSAPYSLAAFATGATVVLLTLLALTRSRKRLPAPVPVHARPEPEPVEPAPVAAIARRRWEVLVERNATTERILP